MAGPFDDVNVLVSTMVLIVNRSMRKVRESQKRWRMKDVTLDKAILHKNVSLHDEIEDNCTTTPKTIEDTSISR